MLTGERQSRILELVNRQKSVKLTEICSVLDISESTARRDLKELAERNLLIKVHGGAMAKDDNVFNIEANVEEKSTMNVEEKRTIGKYAASLVKDGDYIFLDAGTTTECMIDFMPTVDAVFVTNGLAHALRLAKKGLKVILTGGSVKAATEALVGAECIRSIVRMNYSKCFIGANGVSQTRGITTPDITEASIKEAAINYSDQVYILADHTKFDVITAVRFAELGTGTIITDSVKNKKYKNIAKMVIVDEL